MLAERLDDSASVLAVREGCAVEGPWVRPERREDVERISARSCFLCNDGDSQNAAVLGSPWEIQLGRRTTCLQGIGAAIGHQGLVLSAAAQLVLVVIQGLLLVLGDLSVAADPEVMMAQVTGYLWVYSCERHHGFPVWVEGRVVCWSKWPRICPCSVVPDSYGCYVAY